MNQNNLDNLSLCELNSILYRQFQIYINNEMKEYGINSSELMFLVKVEEYPLNQKYISDILHMDYAIGTRSLKSLENKKLINRIKSKEDGRQVLVSLTDYGKIIKEKGLDIRKSWKKRVFKDISSKEEIYLMNILKNMAIESLEIIKDGRK